ncbi:histidine N-alpha-methyltransferase-like [Branchiostoma floridae]|uniref:Histidine N-alpha-methyltransferase-like n=1 Tax=Branchiostoma floridae TaxID=7739 RepID=A0A9J7L969_BRAFL|nr:histidine N-alpha-methyltransferase-like [Branchiostoma floridae]
MLQQETMSHHSNGVSAMENGHKKDENNDVMKENNDVIIRDVPQALMPVVAGLISKRKSVPYWYLYDTRGSELFEEVVRTSKTYLNWQKEYSVLQSHSDDIVAKTTSPVILVELGSGASSKTRLVIEAMLKRHGTLTFVPVDVSKEHIEKVGQQLEQDYQGLTVEPFGGLYMEGIRHLSTRKESKVILFLGNSFSNVHIHEQVDMMKEVRAQLTAKDRFLLALDMNLDRESLLEAYGQQWVVFQKDNPIGRLNKDFDGDMDAAKFELVTDFIENPADGDTPSYVAGYWRSLAAQHVNFRKLGLNLDCQKGQKIFYNEGPNWSCKWTLHQIRRLAEKSGFAVEDYWTTEAEDYCVVCFAPVS